MTDDMIKLSDDFIAQMRHILPDECDALLEAITTTEGSVVVIDRKSVV